MDLPPSMKNGRQMLARRRAADGITPGWDSKTEAHLDRHSPLRNPALAQESFERRRALRLAAEARKTEEAP